MTASRWRVEGSRCLVVGGAGLVGAHIVEALINAGAGEITIYDSLVRGTQEQVERVAANSDNVHLVVGDIRDADLLTQTTDGMDFVFSQAAMWLRQCPAAVCGDLAQHPSAGRHRRDWAE